MARLERGCFLFDSGKVSCVGSWPPSPPSKQDDFILRGQARRTPLPPPCKGKLDCSSAAAKTSSALVFCSLPAPKAASLYGWVWQVWFLILDSWLLGCLILDSWSLILDSWFSILESLLLDSWLLDSWLLDSWFLVIEYWFLVLDSWFLIAWFLVLDCLVAWFLILDSDNPQYIYIYIYIYIYMCIYIIIYKHIYI